FYYNELLQQPPKSVFKVKFTITRVPGWHLRRQAFLYFETGFVCSHSPQDRVRCPSHKGCWGLIAVTQLSEQWTALTPPGPLCLPRLSSPLI
ncbi:hypothetical protein LEMLEM_LOCUS18152, partial [Lemmus lemmus]